MHFTGRAIHSSLGICLVGCYCY